MKPIDAEIDRHFAEPVIFTPMKRSDFGYRELVPDDTRTEMTTYGIYDQSRAVNEATGGGFMHQQSTAETVLSIREEPIRQFGLRKGDRVTFPGRNETHEVVLLTPDPGGRPDVQLVRIDTAQPLLREGK